MCRHQEKEKNSKKIHPWVFYLSEYIMVSTTDIGRSWFREGNSFNYEHVEFEVPERHLSGVYLVLKSASNTA